MDAGFLCDKTALPGEKMKGSVCMIRIFDNAVPRGIFGPEVE